MRITDRMIVNHSLSYLQRGRQRLGEAQTRVVTGRRLQRSSDNPADVERAMTLASELRMVEKQNSNLQTTRDWLSGTDVAVSNLNDTLITARSLALRAKNDTFSENERSAMSKQIGEMLNSAMSIANTQQGGSYLFSGQQVKTQPFSIQGGTIVYQGDNANINHIVELGQTMTINITGVQGNNLGVFGALNALQALQEGLAANDLTSIDEFMDRTDGVMDDLFSAQSALGVRMQRIDATSERFDERETDLKQLYSELVDADMAEVIAEMNAESTAYEMSLATTARIMPRSLLDFLR
ncbi:MAG: flagellar hook-associated protein FlgL [Caldilineaceae bacterium]|nr:flagellar hook-associated protein FlgL [Caldilineaceae bacterium]